jgi:hypothetical protein
MKWYLPNFVDAYTLNTKTGDLNIGAYLGTKMSSAIDNANLNAPSIIVQQNSSPITANSGERNSELYQDSDDSTLPGKMLVETFNMKVNNTMQLFMKRKTTYAGSLASGYLMTRHLKEVQFTLSNGIQVVSGSSTHTFKLTDESYDDLNMGISALDFRSSSSTEEDGIIKIVLIPFEDIRTVNTCSHVYIKVKIQTLPDGTSEYKAWLKPVYISPSGTVIEPSTTASDNFYWESSDGTYHNYVLNVPTGRMAMPPRYWKFRFHQVNANNYIPSRPTKYLYEYDYNLRNASGTDIKTDTGVSIGTDLYPDPYPYHSADSNLKLYMNVTPKAVDVMSVAGIHFWVGNNNYYGAMYLDDGYMPPVVRTAPAGEEEYTLLIYLSFTRINELNLTTTQFTLPSTYSSQILLDKDTTGGDVTTDVGG